MTKRVAWLFLVAVVLALASASLPAQVARAVPRNGGACFYDDLDFRGRYFCVAEGGSLPTVPPGFNDRISSIQVFGNSEVAVYRDSHFSGRPNVLARNVANMRFAGLNDTISSIRVYRRGVVPGRGPGSRGGRGLAWGRPQPPAFGACFYEDSNFRGRWFCARPGDDLSVVPRGFNDRISSIRLFGATTVTVYRDDNFDGQARRFQSDVADVRSMDDRISSIQVHYGADGGWGGPGGRGGRQGRGGMQRGACFFSDANFGGRSFCLERGDYLPSVPGGFNDRVSSIQVFGGARVTIFEHSNFSGRDRRFNRDVIDLGRSGFNDRVSSIRVD